MKAKITRYYYDDTRPTIRDYIECHIWTYDGKRNKNYWSLLWRISYEDVNVHSQICPETTFDSIESFYSRIVCLQRDGYKIQFEGKKLYDEKGGDKNNEKL